MIVMYSGKVFHLTFFYLLSWFCVASVLGVSLDVPDWAGSGDTGDSLG